MSDQIKVSDKIEGNNGMFGDKILLKGSTASSLALEADTLRASGNYARAVVVFNQALKTPGLTESLKTWVHAHVGASWLGLGNLNLAVQNLNIALQRRPNYAWARAHKGEAFRFYAMHNIARLRSAKLLVPCMAQALYDLEAASKACPNSAWIMAHYGAAWTLAYFVAKHVPNIIEANPGPIAVGNIQLDVPKDKIKALSDKLNNKAQKDELADEAMKNFEKAVELCPAYAWAIAFQAVVLVLRSKDGNSQYYKEALQKLGEAQLCDSSKSLLVKTGFFKISSYLGRYETSVETAFQAQADDPQNMFAPYFIAVGLRKMAEQERAKNSPDAETWDQVAQSAAQAAMNFLDSTQALVNLMKAGLHDAMGQKDGVELSLIAVRDSFDFEAIAMLERDPMLDAVRQATWFKTMFSNIHLPFATPKPVIDVNKG